MISVSDLVQRVLASPPLLEGEGGGVRISFSPRPNPLSVVLVISRHCSLLDRTTIFDVAFCNVSDKFQNFWLIIRSFFSVLLMFSNTFSYDLQ